MFDQSVDDRLSNWSQHRRELDQMSSDDAIEMVWEYWKDAPFVPYNRSVDPYYPYSWPTPWEIIADNVYDDFTKALMIGWTLKLTKKFHDSQIEIRTFVDKEKHTQYNIVCVDDRWAINYNDNGPVSVDKIQDSFFLENLIELAPPR